ncbi:MAG: hypothetical protein A2Z02_00735, partial [Chloroflexi bacterium RBG_16_48_7]
KDYSWIFAAAIFLGIMIGSIRAVFKNASGNYRIERHSIDSFLEHWGTGTGIFMLIFSGYRIFSGSGTLFAVNLHFAGMLLVLFFGCYFIAEFFALRKYNHILPNSADIVNGTVKKYFLRMPWDDRGKYLSSQKAAFLAFAALGSEVVVTGAIKLAALFFNIPPSLVSISTLLHDVAGVLVLCMLLVHVMLIIAVRSHRLLLGAWFTGRAPGHNAAVSGDPVYKD